MRLFFKLGPALLACSALSTFAAPALAEEAEGAPPTPSERVTVVLRADNPHATLERRAKVETYAGLPIKDAAIAGVATWTPECTAPCEASLDPKFTYRIGGDGLVPSDAFTVPHGANPFLVDARMGSATGRLGGLAVAGAGAGGLVLGATALAVSPILAHDDIGSPALRTGVLASGIAVTALGACVLGAGLWLWSKNDTKVFPDPSRGFTF